MTGTSFVHHARGSMTPQRIAQAAKGKRMATKHNVPKRFRKGRGWR